MPSISERIRESLMKAEEEEHQGLKRYQEERKEFEITKKNLLTDCVSIIGNLGAEEHLLEIKRNIFGKGKLRRENSIETFDFIKDSYRGIGPSREIRRTIALSHRALVHIRTVKRGGLLSHSELEAQGLFVEAKGIINDYEIEPISINVGSFDNRGYSIEGFGKQNVWSDYPDERVSIEYEENDFNEVKEEYEDALERITTAFVMGLKNKDKR